MSQPDEELSAIDPALLDAVLGGTATDDQVTEALKQIKSTIDDLKSTNNNSTNWLQTLIPMLLFARGGSFSFGGGTFNIAGGGGGACGCGCGGLGLCRRR